MNMNDNYLWDRTGEPDAELQQLEELLGTLRYQPRPLEIPANANVRRKRTFIPLAVAAAIALLMIGAGLWLRLGIRFANSNQRPVEQANHGPQSVAPEQAAPPLKDQLAISSPPQEQKENSYRSPKANQKQIAFKPRRSIQPIQPAAPVLTQAELAQKEQVLVALRLVSAKLNLAQRRAQGLPQVNAIRNHKIG
jgi:hypothetical protein